MRCVCSCFAKLGAPLEALRALDLCIAAGPGDEQITDSEASLAPRAVVARCLLLQDDELKQQYSKARASLAQTAAAAAPAASAKPPVPKSDADYTRPVWDVPVTKLEEAIERSLKARLHGIVPLSCFQRRLPQLRV